MKKMHVAVCSILVFGGLRCLAEDFTIEGNLNVTSNLTSQSFSSLGAAVGLLIVEDEAVMNGPLTVSGPISGNGSGLTNLNVLGSLPANSITSAKLATGAITATKLAANSVGATAIASGAVTSAKLAANSVGAIAIISNAVTSVKLADGAVTASKLAVGSVGTNNAVQSEWNAWARTHVSAQTQQVYVATAGTARVVTGVQSQLLASALQPASITNLVPYTGAASSVNLGTNSMTAKSFIGNGSGLTNLNLSTVPAGSITSDKLAVGSVTSSALASGAVTSAKIAANSVGSTALASGTVTSVKLADGAVTASKLAVGSVGTNNAVQSEWNAWARTHVSAQTQQVYVATAGTARVVTGVQSQLLASALQPASITNLVPYTGAASSVNLGTNSMTAKSFIGNGSGLTNLNFSTFAAGSITSDKLATGAITAPKLATGSVGSSAIATGAVTSVSLADNSVGSSHIIDGAISAADLASGSVGTNKAIMSEWNAWARAQVPAQTQQVYVATAGTATTATTVAGAQSNLIASALQPASTNGWTISSHSNLLTINGNGSALSGIVKTSDTNGWTVSGHGAWITAAQVPAQTQQIYVATAGTAGAVTGVQSQLLTSALQPASITNLVPYTGAASSVDLGTNSMTAKLFIGDGSGLTNLNLSTVASESITSDKLAIGAVTAEKLAVGSVGTNNAVQSEWNAWARAQVPAQTQQVYVATAGTAETVTGVQSQLLASALQPVSINNLVPYTGATSSVNFGTNSITAGAFSGDGSGLTGITSATTVTGSQSNTIETVDMMANALGKMLTVRGLLTNDITSSQPYPIDIPTNMPVMYAAVATGSDAKDGLTWGTAKQSIQAAIDVIGTNGVIYVDAGVYTPITVLSNHEVYVVSVFGPSVTSINGQGTNRCATLYRDFTDGYTLYTNATLIGFTLTNGIISAGYPDLPYDGDWAGAVEGGRLYNCVITGCGASRAVLGITLANRTYFENCLIYSNNINAYPSAYFMMNCVLVNSVVADNITSGDWAKTLAGGYVYNSIIKNNVAAGNPLYVDFYRSVSDRTGTGCVFHDGSLLNPVTPIVFTNGYWLADDSTYLSFGTTNYVTTTTDLARGPRKLLEGDSCSIGCYEGPYRAAKRTYIDDPNMTALDRLLQSYERSIDSVTKREAVTEARISTNDQQVSSIANRVSGIESRTNAYETTVTRAATALQPASTNGWTISAHDAWITAAQVPAQTQQIYVATAGAAGAVTGVQSQLLTSALQPASITNLVPYTGAASSVDLGTNSLTAKLFIGDGSGLTNLNLSTVASESITSDKLAIGAVTAEKLAVGSVGTNNAVQSEWNAWARAQVPAQTQQVYVATAGTATTAGTVTGAQSNTIACALQPANTNGWTVSAHDAWITAPTATNIAQAVVAPYTNAIATAWQNPASATNWTWTSDGKEITLTGYNFATGGPAVVVPDMLDGLPVRSIIAGVFNSGDPGYIGTAIASVSGGNNITTIGDHAFFDCTNLTTVSLPQVVTIGAATFVYCYQLTTVDLRNATTIGDHSFRYCTNLTSLTFSQNAPAEGSGVFSFIPDNQVTNYVTNPTATGWGTTWNSRPVVRLDMYGNLTGNATTATTVTGAQSNLIASALQPASTNGWTISSHSNLLTINGNGAALSGIVKTSDTNGWTVSAHDAWITAAQVPAQTQQVYVATAGTAGAVTGVQSQLLTSALQPASITNLVPYTGAASGVNLGTNSMTAKLFIGDGSGLTNLSSSMPAPGSITSDKLAVGAVTAANLSAGSVGSSALAFNAVTTEKLADGAVTGGKIASGVINSEHLAEGSVTVAKLAISSNLNMNGNRVTNLALPANDGDAVSKAYLRAVLSAIPPQGDLSMGSFTNGAPASFPLSF